MYNNRDNKVMSIAAASILEKTLNYYTNNYIRNTPDKL